MDVHLCICMHCHQHWQFGITVWYLWDKKSCRVLQIDKYRHTHRHTYMHIAHPTIHNNSVSWLSHDFCFSTYSKPEGPLCQAKTFLMKIWLRKCSPIGIKPWFHVKTRAQQLLRWATVWPQQTLAEKWDGLLWGRWVPTASPSNTMWRLWPGPRPTSLPSGIWIHPTVWTQL